MWSCDSRTNRLSWLCCLQAEDGIRDHCVTGVQTCALPIWQSNLLNGWHDAGDLWFAGDFRGLGDRKSVVEGKSVDLGGRPILKKKEVTIFFSPERMEVWQELRNTGSSRACER